MVFTPSSLIRVYGLFGFAIYNLAEVCMLMHVCVRTHTYEWVHTWLHLCIVMAQITWSLFPSHCGFMKALIFCHLARGRAMLGIGPHGLLEWKRCSSGKLQRCFRRNWKERIKGVGESYFRINPREGLWDFEEIWMYTREIWNIRPPEAVTASHLSLFCWKWHESRQRSPDDLFWNSLECKCHVTGKQATYPNMSAWLAPSSAPSSVPIPACLGTPGRGLLILMLEAVAQGPFIDNLTELL